METATAEALPLSPPRQLLVRFLSATTISFFGDWMSWAAISVFLYDATGGVGAPAAYVLARAPPRLLGPIVGGRLVDRFGAAPLLAVCSLLQGVLTGAVILGMGSRTLWLVYGSIVLVQFAGALARPGHTSITPAIAGRARLQRANALYSMSQEVSQTFGPAVAALVLLVSRPEVAVGIDGVSFLLAGLLVVGLPSRSAEPERRTADRPAPAGMARTLWSIPSMRAFLVSTFAIAAITASLQGVLVGIAVDRLGNAAAVGWLFAASGAGGVAGGLLALRLTVSQRVATTYVGLGAVYVVLMTAPALLVPAAAVVTVIAISSVADLLRFVAGTTGLQQAVAERRLGRANSVMLVALNGGLLAGSGATVVLATFASWPRILEAVGGVCLVLVLLAPVLGPNRDGDEFAV